MKTEDFDNIMNEVLAEETKKLIKEQVEDTNGLIDSVKSFQSLSGLLDKIGEVRNIGSNGLVIDIIGATPKELVDCCGGDSFGKIQTNLMQSLHHDLDDSGFSGDYDIDINSQGNDDGIDLLIRITPNDDEFSKENDMNKEENIKEVEDNGELTNTFGQAMYEEEPTEAKDENPEAEGDKEVILGDEVKEDAGDNVDVELDINEHHKKDKASRIEYICKNDESCKKEELEKLSDEEVEKKYLALEKKLGVNESTKKTVTLNQTEMSGLLAKIIAEAIETPNNIAVPSNGVPGIDVTKKSHKDSGKENADALKAVEKKIKDYLSFEGNTDPEFPTPVGQGEEKVATMNTPSEDEVMELERGRNPADLTYDQEPGETFKERAKLSLVGASEMGNSPEYANAIPSKVGENVAKAAELRKKAKVDEPWYDKEAVPVKEDPKKDDRPAPPDHAVASDILRMKQIGTYSKNSQ